AGVVLVSAAERTRRHGRPRPKPRAEEPLLLHDGDSTRKWWPTGSLAYLVTALPHDAQNLGAFVVGEFAGTVRIGGELRGNRTLVGGDPQHPLHVAVVRRAEGHPRQFVDHRRHFEEPGRGIARRGVHRS